MTHTKIYVASVWWRDNDVMYSVAGWDKDEVRRMAEHQMANTLNDAIEDEIGAMDEPESADEDFIRHTLAQDLCWSGVSEFNWPSSSLGIPAENIAELEQEGITVY